jgi:excisionase family DNA binding protein
MQDLILIPFSKHEFKELLKESVAEALKEQQPTVSGDNSDKLLSVKEASEFLNLARQTIYGFTSQNLIPFTKRGKKLYFSKAELICWLKEGKQKTINEIEKEANQYLNLKR